MKRALAALLFLAAVLVAATGAEGAPGGGRDCGTVNAEGFPFGVHVTKGGVPCGKAEEVARTYLGRRSCGSQNLPACVSHGFHCREATARLQTRTGIAGFCYTLKHQLPPREDQSPYQLSLFTRAITTYVGAEE